MLKIIIVILLIGVLVSLFSGLTFLFKDTGRPESKRTLYALGIRISLATALLATVFYGFVSGELQFAAKAPWHALEHAPSTASDKNSVQEQDTVTTKDTITERADNQSTAPE